ncbi:MAG: tetratricopeptide repeat protein [Magnetococcales bacterium]|nr:tetratricopeptide repeat protein [Magnetococcales bacterium]
MRIKRSSAARVAELYGAGRLKEALAEAGRALAHGREDPYLLNLAAACHMGLGDARAALQCWQRAVAVAPDFAEGHNNLGILLMELRRLDEAEAAFREALRQRPDYRDGCYNLAMLLLARDRRQEAEPFLQRVVRLDPGHGLAWNNLGVVLKTRGAFAEAEAAYRCAIALLPNGADNHYNLANLLTTDKRPAEAEAAFRQTLRLAPRHARAMTNLGVLLAGEHRATEAETLYRQALAIEEDEETWYNLGILLKEEQRLPEAEAAYRRALALLPDSCRVIWNLSLLLLSQGRYEEGWPLHEIRYHPRKPDPAAIPIQPGYPMWQGEEIVGKSLLIVGEQGCGDQIQMARFLHALKKAGAGMLTLVCAPELTPLLATLADADRVLPKEEGMVHPRHDFWVFSGSVPYRLGVTLANLPAPIPCLQPPPGRASVWEARLPERGFRVGLVWKGNPRHKNDPHRSLPGLATLAPLWRVPEVVFVSLQKGSGEEEALSPPAGQPLLQWGEALTDFGETAALASRLDLVITIDSAVAHLAGSLGIPCRVMLPAHDSDWRWLRDREDSPWYPGVMRLFRQFRRGEWQPVVEAVAEELAGLADPRHAHEIYNHALDLHEANRRAEAEAAYRLALRLAPEMVEGLCNLAALMQAENRPDEAERLWRRALALAPEDVDLLNNLGNSLAGSNRHEEAEPLLRQAIHLAPEREDACINLGVSLKNSLRDAEAEALFRGLLARNPGCVAAWNNLGNLMLARCRYAEAGEMFREALRIRPDDVDTLWNLGQLLLTLGRFLEAWPLYELRAPRRKRSLPFPEWRGEDLAGGSLLILPEQGCGDQIQFVRFLHTLRHRGVGFITLVCHPGLVPLFAGLADRVIAEGEAYPAHDRWIFLLSIPHRLGVTLETIPPWRLPAPTPRTGMPWPVGFRVGLAWKGNPNHRNDGHRSLPGLFVLAPLWEVPGVVFVSLQKGRGEEESVAPPVGQPLLAMPEALTDFAATAAWIMELDLVIAVDSAVAHLACSLGKACWILLPARAPDWRWLTDRADSPWYPGVARLFRQARPGDWSAVAERMRDELSLMVR